MKPMKLESRLLRRNTSPARIAGFILSNLIGLAIVCGGLQFYLDALPIWQDDDSFIRKDYLVVNRKVTSGATFGEDRTSFSEADIADLSAQPWVRGVGRFSTADYRVYASIGQEGRSLSTYMFFESIPDEFVDVKSDQWDYTEGSPEVPIIISKDYLTLYNFGFASSAGLPKISESLMSGIPLRLQLRSEDGSREFQAVGRVVGYSSRLNTILVPQKFMDITNRELGSGAAKSPSRLIVDVSSPGDAAIAPYLQEHDMETAGDKSGSQASYLLKVVTGIVMTVGGVITVLSLFILMLSMSLLMEKNRDKVHNLLMLGFDTGAVAAPYRRIVIFSTGAAWVLSAGTVVLLRSGYIDALSGMGSDPSNWWISPSVGVGIAIAVAVLNIIAVNRKVREAWRI